MTIFLCEHTVSLGSYSCLLTTGFVCPKNGKADLKTFHLQRQTVIKLNAVHVGYDSQDNYMTDKDIR